MYVRTDTLQGKTNFFERRVGEYQRANVMSQSHSSSGSDDRDDDNNGVGDSDGGDGFSSAAGGDFRSNLVLDADF
jgi:hypothetical protein